MIILIIGGLMVFFGVICVYTRLEIHGRQAHPIPLGTLALVHRISGYLFLLSYLVQATLMVSRYINYPMEPSPRLSLHVAMGMAIFPLVAIKVVSARYFKRIGIPVFWFLGILLWTLAFTTYFTSIWPK
mgnify:CR=1 FL=1